MMLTKWTLMITLLNWEHGPVPVDPYICMHVQMRVAAGLWVTVERVDGSEMIIRRARCVRTEADESVFDTMERNAVDAMRKSYGECIDHRAAGTDQGEGEADFTLCAGTGGSARP